MKLVNIGGVPEHFNLAWYLTLKDGSYKKESINLRWKDFYGGTGQMCKALRNREIDLAVILTEGIIKDIIEGNSSKIVQTFVETPLIWGVHVAYNSRYTTIEELKGTKAAISRYGSGSHLMTYINAQNHNWNLNRDLKFSVVKDLEGAVNGLTKNTADYFLWEKFTTKPLVDNNTFRHIGDCPSPWPCFVIAAHENFIKEEKEVLNTILKIINRTTSEFKKIPHIDHIIADRYDQKFEDVQKWLSLTEWSQSQVNKSTIENIQNQLLKVGIIDQVLDYSKLVSHSTSN